MVELMQDSTTPIHLVGVGNPLSGDDSVGLYIVSRLSERLGRKPRKNVVLHPITLMPERALSRVDCKKERVLIFDAVGTGMRPGGVILARLCDSKFGYFSTHNVPLRLIPELAENPSNVYLSGIEPGNLDLGEGLTEAVRRSADMIVDAAVSALGGGPDGPS